MKILTLVWSIGIGGTERAAVNYAIGYKQFGNDSRVLVLGEGHERHGDLINAGVDCVIVKNSTQKETDIFNKFKIWNPDIIHIHNYHDSLLPFIDLIIGEHTRVVETNVFSRPNFSKNYKIVDLSLQLSGWGYWKYTRWMKGAAYSPNVAIIPYIVDSSNFNAPSEIEKESFLKAQQIPASAYVIGRLGQPHPSKWDIKLLDVIKQTIKPENNIYYLLVGLPSYFKDICEQESVFFKSRVIQIDKIEGDQSLSLYYHSLDCFAHLSKIGESFGYVLAEALLCKVPVITMLTPLKDNAQFEVVGHGYGGFCVTSTKGFVEAVFKLYTNKNLVSSIRINLADWIQRRFSYNAVIPSQIEMYRTLLDGKQLDTTNVNEIIKGNITLYKTKAFLMLLILKCINSSILYKIGKSFKKN